MNAIRPILVVILLLLDLPLVAQVERVLPRRSTSSLEGTSFVVGFMQNEILDFGIDPRLQIFIASRYDANVLIESALTGSKNVIVRANSVHVETVSPIHANAASEMLQQKSIFITSDAPVVVYVLNTLMRSTDSYAAIPIRHLGTQYYSINRPTDHYRFNRDDRSARIPRVGEFMVMAVEDSTVVTITPAATTLQMGISARTPFSVSLNKGDCYLVQARPTRFGRDDLTGSSISSTRPVAVLSGHVRTSVPLDSIGTKDHLVEQLTPVSKWGRAYVTAPFAITTRPDVYRIMASLPNQRVTLLTSSGQRVFTLPNVGSWVDTALSVPATWSSDDPFFLVQLMPSQQGSQVNFDPAMVIVPAVEQFVDECLFRFPTLEVDTTDRTQTFYHFINLMATSESLPTLTIDGQRATTRIPTLSQQMVPGTNIHWASLKLDEGTHFVSCDRGSFSAIMYGTSKNDSYANLVGVGFDPIKKQDLTPPVYTSSIDCGTITGTVRDVSLDTARLKEARVVPVQTFNYAWTLSEPVDSAGSIEFYASVRDKWRDAQLVIHAYNDRGNGKEWLYRYDAPDIEVKRDVVINARRGLEQCDTVVIYNRDTTPVQIRALTRKGNQRIVVVDPAQPFTIAARDSAFVTVCATQWADTTAMAASIDIELPCSLLKTFYVKTRVSADLRGDSLDLGDVRVGDTACGRMAIVNSGDVPIDVKELIATRLDSGFVLDTAALRLPRSIAPGDTLWVDVCYVPRQVGESSRVDSVISSTNVKAWLVCRARGVRPDVRSIIIDWGERRVGSINDTTLVLRNIGEGWCVSTMSGKPLSPWLTVDPGALGKGARLRNLDSVVIRASYRPSARDTLSEDIPVAIDWAPHEAVSVSFRGFGVMPDAGVEDINFGTIVVATRRDSLVDLLTTGYSGGSAPLGITSVRIMGPDSASFDFPQSLLRSAGSVRPLPSILRDVVTFAPARLGLHECFVEFEHDAEPVGRLGRSRFRVYGRAIDTPRADVVMRVDTRLRVRTCTDEPVTIEIANQGMVSTRIDSVRVNVGAEVVDIGTKEGSFELRPGQTWRHSFLHRWDTTSKGMVVLRVVDSSGARYADTLNVEIVQARASISAAFLNNTGSTVGPAWLGLTAELEDAQDVDVPIGLSIVIDRSRFDLGALDSCLASVQVGGSSQPLPVTIAQEQGRITIQSMAAIRGPWIVSCRIFGTVLWKDPDPDSLVAMLDPTPCYRAQGSEPVEFGVEPCGSRRRIVNIGSRPGITVTPLGQPFRGQISLAIESSEQTTGSVWAESLSGEQFLVAEHLSLQKGPQHCNFSCSRWSSGLYRLVFKLERGVEVTNIIIVN
ncbi:MAG: hypothetical protein FGM33_00850 [Candidatus Kapabacteria bacterium]|nr:hypothetical protein [Candidatus Kapabacteria bacterium]